MAVLKKKKPPKNKTKVGVTSAQVKSTTQTYLVTPGDKLLIVGSGELRV